MTNIRGPVGMNKDDAKKIIAPGKILYLRCRFDGDEEQHNKYFVVASVNKRLLLMKINSRIRSYISDRSYLLQSQITLWRKDNNFLEYDSYLDCSRVYSVLSYEEIETQLLDDPSRYEGELGEKYIQRVLDIVSNSRMLSRIEKQLVIDALSSLIE